MPKFKLSASVDEDAQVLTAMGWVFDDGWWFSGRFNRYSLRNKQKPPLVYRLATGLRFTCCPSVAVWRFRTLQLAVLAVQELERPIVARHTKPMPVAVDPVAGENSGMRALYRWASKATHLHDKYRFYSGDNIRRLDESDIDWRYKICATCR